MPLFAKNNDNKVSKKKSKPGQASEHTRKKSKKVHIHSEDNGNLIDVKSLKLSQKVAESEEEGLNKLDEMLIEQGKKAEHDAKWLAEHESEALKREDLLNFLSKSFSLASLILGQRGEQAKADRTRDKYKDRDFPLPKFKKAFKQRIEQHLDILPKLLHDNELMSVYYRLAKEQAEQLPNVVMSSVETFDMPWQKYIAGFYGLSRQFFVSQLIQMKYGDMLRKSRNPTVIYWSFDMFATYVLANEIIIRLVLEDMEISEEEATVLLTETTDYGLDVADDIEMVNDMDFDELAILTEKAPKPE